MGPHRHTHSKIACSNQRTAYTAGLGANTTLDKRPLGSRMYPPPSPNIKRSPRTEVIAITNHHQDPASTKNLKALKTHRSEILTDIVRYKGRQGIEKCETANMRSAKSRPRNIRLEKRWKAEDKEEITKKDGDDRHIGVTQNSGTTVFFTNLNRASNQTEIVDKLRRHLKMGKLGLSEGPKGEKTYESYAPWRWPRSSMPWDVYKAQVDEVSFIRWKHHKVTLSILKTDKHTY